MLVPDWREKSALSEPPPSDQTSSSQLIDHSRPFSA